MNDIGMSAAVATGRRGAKVAEKDYNPGHTYDEEKGLNGGEYIFSFTNGKELKGNIDDFPAHVVRRLALHGLMQRGGDSYASVKGDVDEAYENCSRVLQDLLAGRWGATREGTGTGPGPALWMTAFARIKGWFLTPDGQPTSDPTHKDRPDLRRVRERIAAIEAEPGGKDKIERLKAQEIVKAEVKQIQFERAEAALRASKDAAKAGSLDDF